MSATPPLECVICLDPLGKQTCHTLPCGHTFHADCHTRWVEHNPTCPLCRDGEEEDGVVTSIVVVEEGGEETTATTTHNTARGMERNSLTLLFLCLITSFAQANIGKDITSFVTQIVGVITLLQPRMSYPLLFLLWCGYFVEPTDHLLLKRIHPRSNHTVLEGSGRSSSLPPFKEFVDEKWGPEHMAAIDHVSSVYMTGILTLYILYYPKMRSRMDSFPDRPPALRSSHTPFASSSATSRSSETEETYPPV